MTRGRRGSLPLRRRALPSPPPCRFIPALSQKARALGPPHPMSKCGVSGRQIGLATIDPYEFEGLITELAQTMGYTAYRTPPKPRPRSRRLRRIPRHARQRTHRHLGQAPQQHRRTRPRPRPRQRHRRPRRHQRHPHHHLWFRTRVIPHRPRQTTRTRRWATPAPMAARISGSPRPLSDGRVRFRSRSVS